MQPPVTMMQGPTASSQIASAGRPLVSLIDIVDVLGRQVEPGSIPTDPFKLIMWENLGYLIDDRRRSELYRAFEATIGLDPVAVSQADGASLMTIAKRGGMRPEVRVERWRTIARIVLETCDGDLDAALRALSVPKARALLKRFPSIGEPGADKVLLFSGHATIPSLESNGLRVLARLGFVQEQPSYAASYRAGVVVLSRDGKQDRDWLMKAYAALRQHGKSPCTRGAPKCFACALDPVCAHVRVSKL